GAGGSPMICLLWTSELCSSDLWGRPEGDISPSGCLPRVARSTGIFGPGCNMAEPVPSCAYLYAVLAYSKCEVGLWHSLLRPGKWRLPSACPTGGSACSREGSPLCTPLSQP